MPARPKSPPTRKYKRTKGQTIVESVGMMVLCALTVASLWGIGNQVMPILFQVLSNSNESAFSDDTS